MNDLASFVEPADAVHGAARLVTDPAEAERALAAVTDHLLPGRRAESRPMIEKELRYRRLAGRDRGCVPEGAFGWADR